jgi:hypothetical protein
VGDPEAVAGVLVVQDPPALHLGAELAQEVHDDIVLVAPQLVLHEVRDLKGHVVLVVGPRLEGRVAAVLLEVRLLARVGAVVARRLVQDAARGEGVEALHKLRLLLQQRAQAINLLEQPPVVGYRQSEARREALPCCLLRAEDKVLGYLGRGGGVAVDLLVQALVAGAEALEHVERFPRELLGQLAPLQTLGRDEVRDEVTDNRSCVAIAREGVALHGGALIAAPLNRQK